MQRLDSEGRIWYPLTKAGIPDISKRPRLIRAQLEALRCRRPKIHTFPRQRQSERNRWAPSLWLLPYKGATKTQPADELCNGVGSGKSRPLSQSVSHTLQVRMADSDDAM